MNASSPQRRGDRGGDAEGKPKPQILSRAQRSPRLCGESALFTGVLKALIAHNFNLHTLQITTRCRKIDERLSQAEHYLNNTAVEAGYIEASNLVESQREYDIGLIGPAQHNLVCSKYRGMVLISRTIRS